MISGRILLRKLALKSQISYGDDPHLTVADLLALNDKESLIWAYYNLEKISFLDPIFEMIGLTEEDKITKPGIDRNKGKKVLNKLQHEKTN